MSRNKLIRILAPALAVMLIIMAAVPATGAQNMFRPDDEDLYFSALTEEIVENVTTTTVRREDFTVNSSCKGEVEYNNVTYCFNTLEAGNVGYVKLLVSTGTEVKRGDPLVEVSVAKADVSIDKLKLEIEAAEQILDDFMATNMSLLRKYEDIIQNSNDANERKTAELLYARLKKSYDEERETREGEIESMMAELNEAENASATQYITAPASGIVRDIARLRNGDTIKSWAYICTIYDTSSFRVRVSGGIKGLSYNMEVSVIQAQNSGAVYLPGRVVTCRSSILPANLIGNTDYIEIEGDYSAFEFGTDVTVSYKSVDVKNALVVDKKAVYSDSKGDYVYVYINGVSSKRYITKGNMNSTLVWVVSGLEEGDTVVIK